MKFKLVEEQINYNANPWDKNEGDCAIRALSLAYDMNYNRVKSELNSFANKNKSKFNYIDTIEVFINKYGYDETYDTESGNVPATVDKFANKYKHGTYTIFCSNRTKQDTSNSFHLVTVVDGKIYDTWDPSNYYVIKAYKIKHHNRTVRTLETESLNEDLKELTSDLVLQFAEKILPKGSIKSDRAFILPSGVILDVGSGNTHADASKLVCQKLDELGYAVEDFINKFDNCISEELLDRLGCIHVNSANENYILLSPVRPTRKQINELGDWIDNFFGETNYKKEITMVAYTLDLMGQVESVSYSPMDYDGYEIATRAVRYFNTGKLFEKVEK